MQAARAPNPAALSPRRGGATGARVSTSSFDVGVRTRECARCGAPVAATGAGAIACRYCGATNELAARARPLTPRALPTLAEELARRSRLAGQLEHPISPNPYSLTTAPRDLRGTSLAVLRDGWRDAKARSAGGARAASEQRDLAWYALHVAEAERRERNLVAARAALETALELLDDAGHRHLIHCRLVTEAVRDRDLASAAAWLGECDPSTEVLELDGAHRKATARLRLAEGAASKVLELVGERAGDVPIVAEYAVALGLLRAGAHEALGRDDLAQAALVAACGEGGDAPALSALADLGFAPRALAARRRALVEIAAAARDAVPVGARVADGRFLGLPLLAALLLVAVTIPRCTFDADPFLGVQGELLCPYACKGCSGPFRIYTYWHHSGGSHSTNGPQYFCRTSTNGVATMTDEQLDGARHKLGAYELSWAPAAATYLSLLGLLLPYGVFASVGAHRAGVAARREKEEELAALAAAAGVTSPARQPTRGPWLGLAAMLLAVALPSLVIALELGLR